MKHTVYILTTVEGGIPEAVVYTTPEGFVTHVRSWLKDTRGNLHIEGEDHRTRAVDADGDVIGDWIHEPADVPPFAWDEQRYELRWYAEDLELPDPPIHPPTVGARRDDLHQTASRALHQARQFPTSGVTSIIEPIVSALHELIDVVYSENPHTGGDR